MKEKIKSILKTIVPLVIKFIIVGVLLWVSLTYVFGVYRLNGNNMYPMLKDGDLCVTYKLEEYASGDVVAYEVNGEVRFGRIVARVGDTVDGDEEGLLVNGIHTAEEVFYPTKILNTELDLPCLLKEGEFVVLNDYRSNMYDSRAYGVISKDSLHGKIVFIFRRRSF